MSIEDKNEQELKETLRILLKPLGMYPKDGNAISSFQALGMSGCFLKNISSKGICKVIANESNATKYLICKSYKQLAKSICSTKTFCIPQSKSIFAFYKNVSNPYYDCKSIEEMMIRYDLANAV